MATSTVEQIVDTALRTAGIPIEGVTFPDPLNRATWVVQFLAAATPAQKAQAATILASVVIDAPAQLDVEATGDMDQKDLRAAIQAVWEAIPSPLLTKAQLRARAIAIRKTL